MLATTGRNVSKNPSCGFAEQFVCIPACGNCRFKLTNAENGWDVMFALQTIFKNFKVGKNALELVRKHIRSYSEKRLQ